MDLQVVLILTKLAILFLPSESNIPGTYSDKSPEARFFPPVTTGGFRCTVLAKVTSLLLNTSESEDFSK